MLPVEPCEASDTHCTMSSLYKKIFMFIILTWIYSTLYTFSLFLYLLLFAYQSLFRNRKVITLLERIKKPVLKQSRNDQILRPSLWIHAVSVGEINAIKPLVNSLNMDSDCLFISTITETGQGLARTLFGDRAHIFYFPLDWQWLCRRHLRSIRPSAVLLTETEIWPSFIAAAKSLNIPVLLINGRISDRSLKGYQRLAFFMRPLFQKVHHFCMQSKQDKQRIIELGAPASRVNQMGNLKYDYHLPTSKKKEELVKRLRQLTKAEKQNLLWVCGSTRPGEEKILLEIFQKLRSDFPYLHLLLAPRHPHRIRTLQEIVQNYKFQWMNISKLEIQNSCQVFLLDTIGDLPYLYQLADVVFMGGSLVATGGHNIIEAAHFSKPILFGPHMENFKEISNEFLEAYAALQIQSSSELYSKLFHLLRDPAARNWLGRNARKVVRDNKGAVNRTLEIVKQHVTLDTGEKNFSVN